jgi:hypothetical protein
MAHLRLPIYLVREGRRKKGEEVATQLRKPQGLCSGKGIRSRSPAWTFNGPCTTALLTLPVPHLCHNAAVRFCSASDLIHYIPPYHHAVLRPPHTPPRLCPRLRTPAPP